MNDELEDTLKDDDDLDTMLIKMMRVAFDHGAASVRFMEANTNLLEVQDRVNKAYAEWKRITTPPADEKGKN